LGLAFFGLSKHNISQSRINLFRQIHEIVYHGNGGYDWQTVYNMPIWLRRFTFQEISNFVEKQNESATNSNESTNKTIIDTDGKVQLPDVLQQAQSTQRSTYK
jgi:hypothetical protein